MALDRESEGLDRGQVAGYIAMRILRNQMYEDALKPTLTRVIRLCCRCSVDAISWMVVGGVLFLAQSCPKYIIFGMV
jgi:hypothetical protein